MRRVLISVAAVVAAVLPGHVAVLAVLACVWVSAMTSTTNTAKTRALEARVNDVVTGQTTTNTNIATLQTTASSLSATVAALNGGTFTDISGSYTVTIAAAQNATLHAGVLSYFTQDSNTSFLSGLTVTSQPTSPGSAPSSYSQSFEQTDLVGGLNSVIAAGQNVGIW